MIYMQKRHLALELVNFLTSHNKYAIFKLVSDKKDIVEIKTNVSGSDLAKLCIPEDEGAIYMGDESVYCKFNFVFICYKSCRAKIFTENLM